MAKMDPKQIEEYRQEKYHNDRRWILNPAEVKIIDEQRMKTWAREVMARNEYKFGDHWKNKQVVASGEIEPEELDVPAIYKFDDLYWFIFKNDSMYSIRVLAGEKLLFQANFAHIPNKGS